MMKVQPTNTVFERGDLARKVSVIVPLHNYADLILDTLSSVAAQTHGSLALIVVDDASTDASQDIVAHWMRQTAPPDMSCVLLANSNNAGLAVTRNTGIARARSEYCFFLDADNLLFPRCIEKHVRALDARRDCIGACSIIEEFGGASALIGANAFDRKRLKRGNYIDAMTMLRRDAVERLGGFHPIKHGWEDYELWLRVCEAGERLLHLPEMLSRYRNHQNSMSRQHTNVGENIVELSRNMERLHPWITLDAPRPQPPRRMAGLEAASAQRTEPQLLGVPQAVTSYKQYEEALFAKIRSVAHRLPKPVDVEIDSNYTGPAHGSPFDPFVSQRQIEDSVAGIVRMLRFGIAAINPRPGVHAARQENGDLIRYRSIPATSKVVSQLPPSMLIHIHAFYPDVVEEMLDYFVDAAKRGRFLITTTTKKNYDAICEILDKQAFIAHETRLIENKGRDIGPFLDHAINYAHDGDTICHVHTKKSPDAGASYGEKWRKSLYGTLLTQTAVDAFADTRLGLLFPDMPRSVGWGKNRPFCEQIAKRLDRRLKGHPGPIPIGNMFFARVEVARAMRDATRDMEWPREPVPYDGTVLHAIERMWPIACEHAGLEWAAIHARPGEESATEGKARPRR
ncbi:MAG: rhamnan synthesis F family protein [Sphingomonas sp.]